MKIKFNKKMQEISEFLSDFPKPIYFVGGCIRDILMKIEPHDYDMATELEPEKTQAWIKSKGKKPWLQGKKFGTIGFKHDGEIIEITTFRKETYNFITRKPNVIYTKHIQEDLSRRDYTINSIACKMNGNLIDPYDGINDIKNKLLVAVGTAKKRFQEDPLRILRGFRQIAKYNFTIEPKTLEKMIHCRWELLRLSKERIIEEFNKVFLMKKSNQIYHFLCNCFNGKIFQIIFPEMQLQFQFDQDNPNHDFTLANHSILTVKNTKQELINCEPKHLWAALLHDVGKPFTKTKHKDGTRSNYLNHHILGAEIADRWLRYNKFSNNDRLFIVNSIKNHINEEDNWLRKYDNMSKKCSC